MHAQLPYAKLRLFAAIDRFMTAQGRREKAQAARWVSAWAHFTELHTNDGLRRRMLQEPALKRFVEA
jgi:hypothetical protein